MSSKNQDNTMCDDITESENNKYFGGAGHVTRRTFNTLAAGGMMSAVFAGCAPGDTKAGITEEDVMIETPDGTTDAYFAYPSKGAHAAVLVWPDILSVRPAFRMMGKRLASEGYAVLTINPYYRMAKAPVVNVGDSFSDPAIREKIMPFARALSAETNVTDAKAFVKWLDAHPAVDTSKKIGTTGYCMGGPMTMRTAAALPDRIGAGASFHGGGVATDKPSSPHLLVPKMKADYLFAVADNDDKRDPKSKELLKAAFKDADLKAEIEVYEGAMHGWCPPDSRAYNEEQAEKAWSRMLALFDGALG